MEILVWSIVRIVNKKNDTWINRWWLQWKYRERDVEQSNVWAIWKVVKIDTNNYCQIYFWEHYIWLCNKEDIEHIDINNTYIRINNKKEYDLAIEFYETLWWKIEWWYLCWDEFVYTWNWFCYWWYGNVENIKSIDLTYVIKQPEELFDAWWIDKHTIDEVYNTKPNWALWKNTEWLLENKITSGENITVSMCDWVYNTDTICGSVNYVTQDQLDKTLLTFNQKKMQTIQEKLFEKFLTKNEKKILDAVEVSQENTERFENVRFKLASLLAKYTTVRNSLTDGYNTADQKKIEEQLTKLDKFNKLFSDDMFNQLSVIRDKIEKSIDKFIN